MTCIIKNIYDSFDNFGFSKGIDESKIFGVDETIPASKNIYIGKK